MLQRKKKGAANTAWSQGKEPAASMATTYWELAMTGARLSILPCESQNLACSSVQPLEGSRVWYRNTSTAGK